MHLSDKFIGGQQRIRKTNSADSLYILASMIDCTERNS